MPWVSSSLCLLCGPLYYGFVFHCNFLAHVALAMASHSWTPFPGRLAYVLHWRHWDPCAHSYTPCFLSFCILPLQVILSGLPLTKIRSLHDLYVCIQGSSQWNHDTGKEEANSTLSRIVGLNRDFTGKFEIQIKWQFFFSVSVFQILHRSYLY